MYVQVYAYLKLSQHELVIRIILIINVHFLGCCLIIYSKFTGTSAKLNLRKVPLIQKIKKTVFFYLWFLKIIIIVNNILVAK